MTKALQKDDESWQIALRWCKGKGPGWALSSPLGQGGTAPVFEVVSPDGLRALKIYDAKFSNGKKGAVERKRIRQQLDLIGHECPFLVQIYDGGEFEGRLFLLMSRASGSELEKCLNDIPRDKIRQIVDQVARAAIFLKERGLCHRDIKAANIFISPDFENCTLLDISVVRNVSDPIGVGTDHEGQLPVVATVRYSPPDYLFRLLEPCPELWHALNVYQLGALFHDLIMKEPLFQAEYLVSSENRYRFAWVIATTEPKLEANDVDRDLIATAKRALDKDWQRRSQLNLEEFLDNPTVQREHALQILGLGRPPSPKQDTDGITQRLLRIGQVANDLENRFLQYLFDKGVRATHEIQPGADDACKVVVLRWSPSHDDPDAQSVQVELQLTVRVTVRQSISMFGLTATLRMSMRDSTEEKTMDLPDQHDEVGVEASLLEHAVNSFECMAASIVRQDRTETRV